MNGNTAAREAIKRLTKKQNNTKKTDVQPTPVFKSFKNAGTTIINSTRFSLIMPKISFGLRLFA